MPPRRALVLTALVGLLSAPLAAQGPSETSLAAAEALWQRRAEDREGPRPAEGPILRAIEAYEALLAEDPENLAALDGLLRALNFRGEYVLESDEARLELFTGSRELADRMRHLVHESVGLDAEERDPPTVGGAARRHPWAAAAHYHSAVHWGQWGNYTGKMKAARQGVAARIRDYALIVLALDERFDNGAALRFLGRLHTEAPRVPFVTGWVDRGDAVDYLDRAVTLAPDEPGGQLFLADALLRFRPARQAEAIERLEKLVASSPRATKLIEDLKDIEQARELLVEAR